MPNQPPYKITSKILSFVAQIIEEIGIAKFLEIQNSPQLCKQNRIKSITSTLAIEGNTLNLEQISAIIKGRSVRGTQKEIAEVRGAVKAYEALSQYQAHRLDDLLDAHRKMTEEILTDAEIFRHSSVEIYKNNEVVQIPPKADRVPLLIENLLNLC